MAQPGVVVIAGTGAVAYCRRADGRDSKAGGWGYNIGDEGSGYDIGRSALVAASQSADGRLEPTQLLHTIPAFWGLPDLKAVHSAIYSGQIIRPQIARLTIPVVDAAGAGDTIARRLLETAGQQLAICALAAVAGLGMIETGLDVFPTGGVFQGSALVRSAFEKAIAERASAVRVKEAAFPPIIGGLLLALRGAHVPLGDSVIANIRATFPHAAASKQQAREQSG
jgi:N-acetylglucosamine kinase-like BadF-type ATPase